MRCGREPDAFRLFGSAEALYAAEGVEFSATHRDPDLAAALLTIERDAYQTEWSAGQAQTQDDAVSDALAVLEALATMDHSGQVDTPDFVLGLTKREQAVLNLLAEGLSDREIADLLSISPRTVSGHVSRILAKMGVESRTAAVASALRPHID
jgi:DNA-binding NarL/FixJ family response regulator